jgi:hypothetical protein
MNVAEFLESIKSECDKIKQTKPPCDLCGEPDCAIVGATTQEQTSEMPCMCPNCKPDSMKKLIFYKICRKCHDEDENWPEKILQKYVYH